MNCCIKLMRMNHAPAEFTKGQSVLAVAKRFALTRMVCFNISIS